MEQHRVGTVPSIDLHCRREKQRCEGGVGRAERGTKGERAGGGGRGAGDGRGRRVWGGGGRADFISLTASVMAIS